MKVYERLRKQGLNPNSTTYNALITAYGKACNLEAVRPPPMPLRPHLVLVPRMEVDTPRDVFDGAS